MSRAVKPFIYLWTSVLKKYTFCIVDSPLHMDHIPVLPASDSLSDNNPSRPDYSLSYLLGMFEIGVEAHSVVPPGLGNLLSQRSTKVSGFIYAYAGLIGRFTIVSN